MASLKRCSAAVMGAGLAVGGASAAGVAKAVAQIAHRSDSGGFSWPQQGHFFMVLGSESGLRGIGCQSVERMGWIS